jgi:hypothetical protein
MHGLKRQRGASLIFTLIVLVVVGFAITIGIRLVPIYINAYTVKTILNEVADESRGTDRNPSQIWASIDKRLDINDVDNIKREHFVYRRDRGVTTIGITYEARTKLLGNLDVVAKFAPAETLGTRLNQ